MDPLHQFAAMKESISPISVIFFYSDGVFVRLDGIICSEYKIRRAKYRMFDNSISL